MLDDSIDHSSRIAIIGMAGRFPGSANIRDFWANLCNGTESIRPFTPEELRASGVSQETLDDPAFVNAGAPLADADCFDAAFFGYLPREAELMDPQQRIFLECAWTALEDSGYDPTRYEGDIGVFGGVARNTYLLQNASTYQQLMNTGATYDATLGSDKDYTATRVAYQMNLHGPAVTVQTACSSSGVAIHLACQSLLNGECDMAMAGGARVQVPLTAGYKWVEGGIPSPDGRCRPFDAEANGTNYGSGVGIVVLKRLEDAIADGDNIYSILLSTAINNDGSDKVGFTAPSIRGQSQVIGMALSMADVSPDTISYVEAHGTGTSIGDPIEVAALSNAYKKQTGRTGYCAIGSLKSNIGHLDAGACVAGLIKASLMLRNQTLVPSLNFIRPNPEIDFENSPFFVNTETRHWESTNGPRRAALSAFGLGGTNFHAVLQEYDGGKSESPSASYQIFLQSAKSADALNNLTGSLAASLDVEPDINLSNVAFTLATGRARFSHRRVTVARNIAATKKALTGKVAGHSRTVVRSSDVNETAFLFSGQGSQYANMARRLYEDETGFRETVDRCLNILADEHDLKLKQVLYPANADLEQSSEQLARTCFTQPALFVIEYSLARLWQSKGITPQSVGGHSIGELVAACIAGIFSESDALRLVFERGRLMDEMTGGDMLAVNMNEAELNEILTAEIDLACVNTPQACVVSGSTDAIATLKEQLDTSDVPCSVLKTSHAFHSRSMEKAVEGFREVMNTVELNAPTLPIVSNVSGDWMTDEQARDPNYWASHIRRTVRIADCIERLLERPNLAVIEVGPGHTLCNFVRMHPAMNDTHAVIQSCRHPDAACNDTEFFYLGLGQLWCEGATLDLDRIFESKEQQRVSLPTYPFERKRYWLRPTQVDAAVYVEDQEENVVPTSTASDRRSIIVEALCKTLEQLSGISASSLDINRNFVELGFDSLFLTRANMEFKKLSGVNVGFRQLFEEAPSVSALAKYIDEHLDEDSDRFRSAVGRQAVIQADELTSDVSGKSSTSRAYFTDFKNVHPEPASENRSARETPVGPWKQIATGEFEGLDQRQRDHLRDLIDRLTAMSPASKKYAETHRPHLADPRSVAGFRRAWKEVVYPVVVDRSMGASVWDIDGNEYTDVAMGFGIAFLGHNPDFVINAVHKQLDKGVEIGPQHPLAGKVAKQICDLTGTERVAFCNTGSEAVLAAVRMARTVTGKNRIAVFSGSYHGIFDEVLALRVDRDSRSHSVPVAPGIPGWAVAETLVLEYDDPRSFDVIRRYRNELAAIIVEPVQSRHPDLQPAEFLGELRQLATEIDIPLVLDEIITGFRCHPGGIQALWGIEADIVTYGKAIGGGFPIAVVAGKRKYLDALDGGMWKFGDASFPEVGVTWFAGTFVRHPVALAAASATLEYMAAQGPRLQEQLNERTSEFVNDLNAFLLAEAVPIHIESFSSLFHVKFLAYQEISSLLYAHLRSNNIHLTEGRVSFLSTAHTEQQIQHCSTAFKTSIKALKSGGFLPGIAGNLIIGESDTTELPLLHRQKEIWFAAVLGEDSNRAFNLTNRINFDGSIDIGRLKNCLQWLVDRHESLRTRFDKLGERQYVEANVNVSIVEFDLSKSMAADRNSELLEICEQAPQMPMDLETGPLFHCRLIHVSDSQHVLLLTVHHIISDGWSTGVLMRELGERYKNASQASFTPPAAEYQLSDFVKHEKSAEMQVRNKVARDYWLRELNGRIPALRLPLTRPRDSIRTFTAGRVDKPIPREIINRINDVGQKYSSTLYTTLLSAYAVFLHKLTGQTDIVIGVSAAQQVAQGMLSLVAHAVSMLPLRLSIKPTDSFSNVLRSVRHSTLGAFDHQECTYGEILPIVDIERIGGQPPLVSAVFNLDPSMTDIDFGEIRANVTSAPRQFEVFDWFFNVVDLGEGVRCELTYNADLFSATNIGGRLQEFSELLETLSDDTSVRLQDLSLLLEKDKAKMLGEWNATETPGPTLKLVDELLLSPSASPSTNEVLFADERISQSQLRLSVEEFADRIATHSIATNEPVGILLHRSPRLLTAILGVLRAGGAYLPLDPAFPAERLAFMLKDSGTRLLVTEKSVYAQLPDFNGEVLYIDGESEPKTLARRKPLHRSPDDLAYYLYTSGSSGKPKCVIVPHRCVSNFLFSMATRPGLSSRDTLVAVTTSSFDISVLELFLPIMVGARLVIASSEEGADGGRLRSLIEKHSANVMQATPATWRMLVDAGWNGGSQFRALCGGETLPQNLANELLKRCGEVWNLYGPTETTVWSTCGKVTKAGSGFSIPIGRPIANTTVHIVDHQMCLQPPDLPGEICIGGAGVARGYLGLGEMTAQKFLRDPYNDTPGGRLYRTGDLGRWDSDGQLQHLGRIGSQVKIRGFRIELGEIESVLAEHEAVSAAACQVWEPASGDQRLIANVVVNDGYSPAPTELRKYLRNKLPDYMIPQVFRQIDELPLTPNRKIDRKALPDPANYSVKSEKFEEPNSEAERTIANIWRNLIGVDKVGRHDNFFELGGHSLLAVRALIEIQRQLGGAVELRQIVLGDLQQLAGRVAAATDQRVSVEDSSPF